MVPPNAAADAARITAATGRSPLMLDRFSMWVIGAP